MFLHIKDSSFIGPIIGNIQNAPPSRNLYLEHKIYGTPDTVRSSVSWDEVNPDFDHRISMALNIRKIRMSRTVPLTVAVWDKQNDDSGKDILLGYAKINISSLFGFMGHLKPEEIKDFVRDQGDQIIDICS